MRSLLVPLPFLLLACAPPPPVALGDTGIAPSIEVIYPPNGGEVTLEEDCSLEMVVAVQIENFVLEDFDEQPDPEPGKGHWHLQIGGETGYQPIDDAQSTVVVRESFSAGLFNLTVTLVDAQHQPIDVGQDEYIAEVTAVEPPQVSCN